MRYNSSIKVEAQIILDMVLAIQEQGGMTPELTQIRESAGTIVALVNQNGGAN